MIKEVAGFEWDDGNTEKCRKHGLSTDQIEELFSGDLFILGDDKHSQAEKRFIAVGRLSNGRGVFVGFTLRESLKGSMIRPITARYMHKREFQKYEKTIAEISK
ncbi:MAG: BrnT family toxin [Acidobacteria bacterium]|nr:BrnT family toxin [Acidobacteriota bacterium]